MSALSYSFLSGGSSFHIDVGPLLHPVPMLESPLAYRKSFARSMVFYPDILDKIIVSDLERSTIPSEEPALSVDGRLSAFYEADPGQTHIRWELSSGGLYTHVRDEDRGEDGIDLSELLANVDIVDDGPHPIVLTTGELSIEAFTRPGYEEFITFFRLGPDGTSTNGTVEIRRPGWISPSVRESSFDSDGHVVHERGVTNLIDLTISGASDVAGTEALADEFSAVISDMR